MTSGIAGQKGVALPPNRTGAKLETTGISNPLNVNKAAIKPTAKPAYRSHEFR